jgi:hypothetical protein
MNSALRGRQVTALRVSYELQFEFTDVAWEASLTVGGRLRLVGASTPAQDVDPEEPRTLAPVLTLLRSRVSEVVVSETGALTVYFVDGRALEVAPDGNYEAWGFVGPRRARVVCMPGGSLAYWFPHDDRADG